VIGEGWHLPHCAGSFGYVLMMTVICFPDDVIAVFHGVYRVLIQGGMLVVWFIEAGALPTNPCPLRLTSHPLRVFPG